jgi:hypothetical protein
LVDGDDRSFFDRVNICSECGAPLGSDRACRDYFNDLLALEWRVEGGPGEMTHFFAVASYNLQHPSGFSPAALASLLETLGDVLAGRATIADARQRARVAFDGATKVTRNPGTKLTAAEHVMPDARPKKWAMTVRDVCDVRPDQYIERARAWAESVGRAYSLPHDQVR